MNAARVRSILFAVTLGSLAVTEIACDRSEATKPRASEAPAAPIVVTLVSAEQRALPGGVDVTGTLMADAQTEVAAENAGRVLAVLVERGSVVRAGTVLARLDGEDAKNQLLEAEATEGQTMAKLGLTNGTPFDPRRRPTRAGPAPRWSARKRTTSGTPSSWPAGWSRARSTSCGAPMRSPRAPSTTRRSTRRASSTRRCRPSAPA
ncbi:MAG: biotin/lipoyl-binding protein [Candidatus Rokubacteria bacterium]|nr:biotin/lipoyl-binding protein [Candidatus Rokubacteria bacterium]